jgi:hypothetical protein
MAIDIHSEELRTLRQAAASLPGTPAPSTTWRWSRRGVRGIRLETVVIGGTRYTSLEALSRFAVALTAASEPASTAPEPGIAPTERDESTQRRLKAAGLMK